MIEVVYLGSLITLFMLARFHSMLQSWVSKQEDHIKKLLKATKNMSASALSNIDRIDHPAYRAPVKGKDTTLTELQTLLFRVKHIAVCIASTLLTAGMEHEAVSCCKKDHGLIPPTDPDKSRAEI
jgi:hypothetical protein